MKTFPIKALRDHVEIMPGYAFKSDHFSDRDGDIPLVKGENLHQEYIDWSTAKKWPVNELAGLEKYLLHENDIVLAMDRPWVTAGLKWAVIKRGAPKSLLVQRVARLRSTAELDQVFLRYIIGSPLFSNYVQPIVTGVNVPHISGGQIGSFKLPLPPLPIQRKIAAILSAYDELIENNNRRIAILEKMAEEIYREWFVRLRFPGHEKVKVVKGVPQGWEVCKLGNIVSCTMGQSPPSESYNNNGIGLPFNQGVGTYGLRFPKREVFCTSKGRIAQKGDILFSVRAPVGRLNIADCKMIIGRGLCAVHHKVKCQNYLWYLLKHSFSSEDIIGNGAIFSSVGKDELLNFKVVRPCNGLDKIFDDNVKTFDNQIENLLAENNNLKKTRDLLLPRLISGKLDVENLDIAFPPGMEEELEHARVR